MSTLLQWFASAEWVQIVTALLHSLWQGAVIALLLALFLRRFSDPVVRYRVSLAALVGVVLAGMLTWAVLTTSEHNSSTMSGNETLVQSQASRADAPLLPDNAGKIIVTAKNLPPAPDFHWTGWLALIWLVGCGLMLIRTAVKVAGAGRLRRSCRPLNDARIEALLAEARHAVGLMRQVRVGVTDQLTSPAVVGVLVPMLVLPLSLLSTLTPEQIRFVLLHELAHIRRGDYLANLFQFFVESLLFFNPAIWWISHQVRREREACCDALATALSGAPADYARTLVHVAENALQPTPATAPAIGDQRDSSSLLERIHRLLVPGYRPSLRLTWRAMLAGLTLGSALLILSAVGTRTTVAAILSSEKPIASVSQATNQISLLTPVQTNGISSDLTELKQRYAEIQSQFEEARDQQEILAVKLGMPHDMAQSAMQLDAETLQKMFQAESLSKYMSYADKKRELDVLQRQLNRLEMDMLSKSADDSSAGSSKQLASDSREIDGRVRFLNDERIRLSSGIMQERRDLETLSKLYAISEPIDVNKITERNFPEYAEYISTQCEYERLISMNKVLAARTELWKHATNQTTTNLVLSKVTEGNFRQYASNMLNERFLADSNRFQTALFGVGQRASLSNSAAQNLAFRVSTNSPMEDLLENIRLDHMSFNNLPLSDVISELNRRSPGSQYLKYLGGPEVTHIHITLKNDLYNVRLKDALDTIVAGAEKPISYIIEDGDVAFEPVGADQLKVRIFKVDPEVLMDNLNARLGPGATNDYHSTILSLRHLFEEAGAGKAGPTNVAYIPPMREIILRGTDNDVHAVETVLRQLNSRTISDVSTPDNSPENPTNTLLVRWFKVEPYVFPKHLNVQLETGATNQSLALTKSLREYFQKAGIDLHGTNKALFYNDRSGVILARATAKDLDAMETIIQQLNYTPPLVDIKTRFIVLPDALAKSLLKDISVVSNDAPAGGFHAVLFPGQAKQLITRCDQTPEVNSLTTPEVTTASGRQAQVEVIDVMTLVKGIRSEALKPPGITNQMFYQTEGLELGPIADYVPRVSADEYTIQLSAAPHETEFLGYDGQTKSSTFHVFVNGTNEAITLRVPRPHLRTRSMSTHTTLLDGQTLLLGGAPWVETSVRADGTTKTNTLADSTHKQLFVLVTPILIDPAGNRIHTPEEMRQFSDAKLQLP